MIVDAYRSAKNPSYGIVVPAGTTLDTLHGEAGTAIAAGDWTISKRAKALDEMFGSELVDFLAGQIAEKGAGLVKINVQFTELVVRK